ncbi:hypothetical protein K438DRAFT_1764880 [Mycena galopus ATCC 62051]|nr:hypothetical protein K438DRAFT_1764880 [Mycena galopus ATCC 62051]
MALKYREIHLRRIAEVLKHWVACRGRLRRFQTMSTPARKEGNKMGQKRSRDAQAIVKGTQCSVSVALCARVAIMYWDCVDKRFAKIRAEANGDPKILARYGFRFALTSDQDKHGSKDDYTLDETAVDEFQQKVDDLIDIGVVDAASSAQDEDAE